MNRPQLRFPEFKGNWEKKKLENIADVKTGPFGSSLHQHDYVEIGTPIITVEHLDELGIVHKNLPLVSDEDKSRLKSYHLKTGDLVFSRVGSVDRCSIITERENGWLFSGRLLRVRFQNQIPAFFNYQFQLETTKQKVRSIAVGQTMPSINTEILKSIELTIATLPEQTKIASFLTAVDEKIQAFKKKHNLLEQYKKGVMQKLFSQELRFKDENGKEFKEWEEKNLRELVEIKKGEQLNKEELNETGDYPCINGGINPSGFTNKFNTNENTITISEGGNSCGYINFFKTKFWSGGHNYSLSILEKNKIDNTFLYHALKNYESEIMTLRVGSGLPNIQKKDLLLFKINFPSSLIEQTNIANFLSELDKRTEIVQVQIENTEAWKKGLVQKMFC